MPSKSIKLTRQYVAARKYADDAETLCPATAAASALSCKRFAMPLQATIQLSRLFGSTWHIVSKTSPTSDMPKLASPSTCFTSASVITLPPKRMCDQCSV